MANLDFRQALLMERVRLLQVLILEGIGEQGYRLPALFILAIGLILGRQANKLGNRCVRHDSFQLDPFVRCFGGWWLLIECMQSDLLSTLQSAVVLKSCYIWRSGIGF